MQTTPDSLRYKVPIFFLGPGHSAAAADGVTGGVGGVTPPLVWKAEGPDAIDCEIPPQPIGELNT